MWEAELGGVGKVKNAVGSKSKWYQTGSNYWAVPIIACSSRRSTTMEYLEGTAT